MRTVTMPSAIRILRPVRTIKGRLVRNVALAMLLVLTASSGFVFWRVQHALDRQLSRDLRSYHDVVTQAVRTQTDVPTQTPGLSYQVFDSDNRVRIGSAKTPVPLLLDRKSLATARTGVTVYVDRGGFLPPGGVAIRVEATTIPAHQGRVVVATAISRQPRDEALRELLGQLAIADVLVLLAASYVGYRTARGALDPVERYRRAAKAAGETSGARLPVAIDREDELTRLGHTFNDLLARIEAATEREHQYIADASHELRTPLALLKAEVEFALHKPRSAEYTRQVLVSVAAEVDRMADLANALLDLEELESGVQSSEDNVDIRRLLTAAADRYRSTLEREGRDIVVDAPALMFVLSAPWIDAALSNLVVNAVRYGRGTVTLSARSDSEGLLLAVWDEGEGFPESLKGRAFDRFTRADQIRTTRGSGLGLALVKAVAQAHGGSAFIDEESSTTRVVMAIPPQR